MHIHTPLAAKQNFSLRLKDFIFSFFWFFFFCVMSVIKQPTSSISNTDRCLSGTKCGKCVGHIGFQHVSRMASFHTVN